MMKANILRKGLMLVSALTLSFSIAHATDWLEKGGVGKQDPSEPSLQMPLSFEAGYTQFLDDCEDADTKIVTPVSCGVYGISTNGTVTRFAISTVAPSAAKMRGRWLTSPESPVWRRRG